MGPGLSSSFMDRFNEQNASQGYSNPIYQHSQIGPQPSFGGSLPPSFQVTQDGYSQAMMGPAAQSFHQPRLPVQGPPPPAARQQAPGPMDAKAYSEHIEKKLGEYAPPDESGNMVLLYQKEFSAVPKQKPGATFVAARDPANQGKNRYADVLAYDDTRVMLSSPDDYINANYVKLRCGGETFNYVTAQGPLSGTVDDFYTMMWDQKIRFVIMLARDVENGQQKCACYWPDDGQTAEFGDFSVTSREDMSVDPDLEGYLARTLMVKNANSGEEREIVQLQFTSWPDHGIPDDTLQFLNFVQKKRDVAAELRILENEPILIHCSAGIGRTGVFCLTEYALSCVEQEIPIDMKSALQSMRMQRPQLVQNEEQYKFCHTVVLDALQVHSHEDGLADDDDLIGSSAM